MDGDARPGESGAGDDEGSSDDVQIRLHVLSSRDVIERVIQGGRKFIDSLFDCSPQVIELEQIPL